MAERFGAELMGALNNLDLDGSVRLNEAGARLDGVGAVLIGLDLVQQGFWRVVGNLERLGRRLVQSRAEHEAAGGLAAEGGVGGLRVRLREPVRRGGLQRRRRPGLGHVCRRRRAKNGGHGGREGTRGGGGGRGRRGRSWNAGAAGGRGGCGAERGRYKTYRGMRRGRVARRRGAAEAGGRDSGVARDCALSGGGGARSRDVIRARQRSNRADRDTR
ncbi:hypothetical protein FGB62_9g317 [Gracilaria domingensis]|nr:hypothetical protein FGB62_9g317 [Gracilaria domingensis]